MPAPSSRRRARALREVMAWYEAAESPGGPVGDPLGVAGGPDPDRVLIIGSGPASGVGAATQQQALPGRLPPALAALTGRGAVVETRGAPHLRLADVPAVLAGARLQRFDALVLVIGLIDAAGGTAARRWGAAVRRQVDALQDGGANDAVIVLTGVPPASSVTSRPRLWLLPVDRRIRRMNRDLQDLARDRPRTVYVEIPAPSGTEPVGGAAWYARCTDALAGVLAEALDPPLGAPDRA